MSARNKRGSKSKRGRKSRSNQPSSKKPQQQQQQQQKQHQQKASDFVDPCRELLRQITSIDDSKPFYTLLPKNDPLYADYNMINSSPISFKTIKERLESNKYKNYNEFNEDIKKIFYQEQRLKNYKGQNKSIQKRFQSAKRVNDYWSTLTAPYDEFGFDAVVNHQRQQRQQQKQQKQQPSKNKNNKNNTNNSKKKTPPPPNPYQPNRNQTILSNIKKRVLTSKTEPSPKRQKLSNKPRNDQIVINREDDDSKKQEFPSKKRPNKRPNKPIINEYNEDEDDLKEIIRSNHNNKNKNKNNLNVDIVDDDDDDDEDDTPFKPFAQKSRIFTNVMGGKDFINEICQSLNNNDTFSSDRNNNNNDNIFPHLVFDDDKKNDDDDDKEEEDDKQKSKNKNSFNGFNVLNHRSKKMHTFKIRFRYDDTNRDDDEHNEEYQAKRMDLAVQQFRDKHSYSNYKILSVKLV